MLIGSAPFFSILVEVKNYMLLCSFKSAFCIVIYVLPYLSLQYFFAGGKVNIIFDFTPFSFFKQIQK